MGKCVYWIVMEGGQKARGIWQECVRICMSVGIVVTKKGTLKKFLFLFFPRLQSLFVGKAFFFDPCFFTGKSAQIVQFGTTYFTDLVHFNLIDGR